MPVHLNLTYDIEVDGCVATDYAATEGRLWQVNTAHCPVPGVRHTKRPA